MDLKDPNSPNGITVGYDPAGRVVGGIAVQVVLLATKTVTTPTGTTSSAQLLAADSTRLGATIVNTDPSSTLWLGVNGATAVVGIGHSIAPSASYSLSTPEAAGRVNGIWTAGVTVGASISAYTA